MTENYVFHGTTILALRTEDMVVVAGDGQVTLGNIVTKHKARKVRRIYHDRIITGFAGATADALTLSEKLEAKLEQYNGSLTRACVELAREWRTDKYLRRLAAQSAALALKENTDLPPRTIVEKAMKIAGDLCIYTNHEVTIEEIKKS